MASARSLSQFQKAFSDEAMCAAFMFKRRWPDGFVCSVCGKRRVAALKSRPRLYECLDCGRQTSITSGTAIEPLEGVVEVDQAEIPFREGDTFLERDNVGKILVIGAVEVIERDTNEAKPRRKHAKYLDTRSGRIRLA